MGDPQRPDLPERDPALDAAWRAYSVETPPTPLDAKILAAAHREARSRPQAAGEDDDALAEAREPSRWWWGLAAAATIGAIAFGIVQLAPPLAPTEPMVASDVPPESAKRAAKVPAPASAPVPSPTAALEMSTPDPLPPPPPPRTAPQAPKASAERAAPARRDAPAAPTATEKIESERTLMQREDGKTGKRERETAPLPAPPPSGARVLDPSVAPQAFPAAPAAPAELKKVEADRRQAPAPQTAEPPTTSVPAAVTAPAPRVDRANEAQRPALGAAAPAVAPPAEYVARIEAHLAAGRPEEAARELNRFRAAYPDADQRLPQTLRAWAATVARQP